MRIHYLVSPLIVNLGMLIALSMPFRDSILSWWLPFTALPYFYLYWRDMTRLGYRKTDILRVYALNLMLIPVNLGGVFKSLQQALTGRKSPFVRTPKVKGRTASAPLYLLAIYGLIIHGSVGGVFSLYDKRFMHAGFALLNAGVMLYAVARFIGLRQTWEDLRLAYSRRGKHTLDPAKAGPA